MWAVVLSRGTIRAGGPYYWPTVRIRGKAVATNAPPIGAFRGFGAPQSLFAMERHMDRIACVLGRSRVEIRRRNFLQREQTTTTEQTVKEEINLNHLLDRALELSGYESKRARFAIENESAASKKGMGIAAFLHGAGFTGSGERYLGSVVGIEAHADGRVRVLGWSAEFGICLGRLRCGGRSRPHHLQRVRERFRRFTGNRQGASPGSRNRADCRRRGASDRLRALRES